MSIKLKYIEKKNLESGKHISSHIHSCVEVIMFLNANGKIKINGKNHTVKTGDIAVINPDISHSEQYLCNSKAVYLGIELADEQVSLKEGIFNNINGFESLHNIVEMIYTEHKNQEAGYKLIISSKLMEFIVFFGRRINHKSKPDKSIERCADYFRDNFAVQINIKDVVESHGFDYERFRKDFKIKYGLAPKQYIVEMRLNYAYNMICNGGMSCTDVAMYCGFSDGSQFSKMFKKRYGITPDKLRLKTI